MRIGLLGAFALCTLGRPLDWETGLSPEAFGDMVPDIDGDKLNPSVKRSRHLQALVAENNVAENATTE
jgi:hypothetical protein